MLLSIAFVVGLIVSCDWRSSEQLRLEKLAQSRKCDTLVMQVIRQKPEKALLFIDSLVTLETPSTERIAYYRALAYNGLGQKQKVEECCRQAVEVGRPRYTYIKNSIAAIAEDMESSKASNELSDERNRGAFVMDARKMNVDNLLSRSQELANRSEKEAGDE